MICGCVPRDSAKQDSLFSIQTKLLNEKIVLGDTILFEITITNTSDDTITTSDIGPDLNFDPIPGWKEKPFHDVVGYDGPGVGIPLKPGERTHYVYDLARYFETIPIGKNTLKFKTNVWIAALKKSVTLYDSLTLTISPSQLSIHSQIKNDSSSGKNYLLSICLVNNSKDTAIINDNATIEFLPVSGWEKREITVMDYNGPGISSFLPGDSTLYPFDLNYFFTKMCPGKKMLKFKFSPGTDKNKKNILFADSITVTVK